MNPHFHISGIHAVIWVLAMITAFGSLHLLAASAPNNRVSQAWFALGF